MRVQSLFVDSERGIIMDKEARDHEFTETSTLESGRETSNAGGSSTDRQHSKRSMPAIRDRDRSVLYLGETCPSRSLIIKRGLTFKVHAFYIWDWHNILG